MRLLSKYLLVFGTLTALLVSCGKETSDTLISFNPEDVELNGNPFNTGCLDCDLFTWCDNTQLSYSKSYAGNPSYIENYKYKNVAKKTVGGFVFTGTLLKVGGDTVFHNCQNNVTRILSSEGTDIFKKVNGNASVGDAWTDFFGGGDSAITYQVTFVDNQITVGGRTYNSNITVQEKKYFTNGSSGNPADWVLVDQTENVYARDRITASRIAGIGLIKSTVKSSNGDLLFQSSLRSFIIP